MKDKQLKTILQKLESGPALDSNVDNEYNQKLINMYYNPTQPKNIVQRNRLILTWASSITIALVGILMAIVIPVYFGNSSELAFRQNDYKSNLPIETLNQNTTEFTFSQNVGDFELNSSALYYDSNLNTNLFISALYTYNTQEFTINYVLYESMLDYIPNASIYGNYPLTSTIEGNEFKYSIIEDTQSSIICGIINRNNHYIAILAKNTTLNEVENILANMLD